MKQESLIHSIYSTLKIEHNSLSLDQVNEIIQGKQIAEEQSEIQEVKNAGRVYELMETFNPFGSDDLLKAHRILMKDLIRENGAFRSQAVGVFDGDILIHLAPPARLVYRQIRDLFAWTRRSGISPLMKSCVFHYEFEFIHPFMDGNGRLGRLWQKLILARYNEIFCWLSIEEKILNRQKEYYAILADCDRKADCSEFIFFMLKIIHESLSDFLQVISKEASQDSGSKRQ